MMGLIVSGLTKAVGGYFENKSKQSVAKSNLKIDISTNGKSST